MTGARAISWSWSEALRGAVCTVPAAVLLLTAGVTPGIASAIGVLPAAVIGVLPSRRQRLRAVPLGIAFAAAYLVGSIVGQAPLLAVVTLFGTAYGAVMLTSRKPVGRVVLGLVLPALAVGLSSEPTEGFGLGLFMLVGTLWATAVTMLWPERGANIVPPAPAFDGQRARTYALLLAAAASLALCLGYVLDLGYLGWAPAAVVFVMRPQRDLLTSRGVGRVLATLAGVVFASLIVRFQPSDPSLAVIVMGVFAALLATRASRWYVTPAFTVTLIMLLVGLSTPDALNYTLTERLADTLLGVTLAYIFGGLVPLLLEKRAKDDA